jgi:hypothetical protein
MIVVKKIGFKRMLCACLGAYWLSGIVNPGFVWVSLLILLLTILFLFEQYFDYSDK